VRTTATRVLNSGTSVFTFDDPATREPPTACARPLVVVELPAMLATVVVRTAVV
jgi:hypothetical protein